MTTYILIVHHTGEHRSGHENRCRCWMRTYADGKSVVETSGELAPTDTHTFMGALSRDRYIVDHVDPTCRVEKRDNRIDPRASANHAASAIRAGARPDAAIADAMSAALRVQPGAP